MDADHVPKDKNKKKKEKKKDEKKKKIMSKFEETLETKKPVFDPGMNVLLSSFICFHQMAFIYLISILCTAEINIGSC